MEKQLTRKGSFSITLTLWSCSSLSYSFFMDLGG